MAGMEVRNHPRGDDAARLCYAPAMLQIERLIYRVGGRALFDGASATIPASRKVGLVGRNGTGKSTLLRLIGGEIQPDGGSITLSGRVRVGGVAQHMPDGTLSPIAFVLAADRERADLLARLEADADPAEVADIHARLSDIQADSAPARAAVILAGLGFDEAAQARPLASFSGGWRMRVALAAALFSAPDLLLLDEPSNHLDLETREWLEGYLASYPGTILLVSHDRTLLNAVVDSILHLSATELTLYRGDYDTFLRTRAERQNLEAAQRAKDEARRQHLQSFVDRFRAKATKAKQAQSRMKALAKLQSAPLPPPDPDVKFDFPSPEPLPSPLMTIDNVAAGYGDRTILRKLNLSLGSADRIALVGANGNGKTTLLKLIEGRLKPLHGDLARSGKLKVGYFEQEQADAFDLKETPLQHLSRLMPEATETKVRGHLGRFGFGQERAQVPIGGLSGGEKARLLFACVARAAPHILLLDEPTNHLDIEARTALIEALADYEGAVILVTHDPSLVELCAERLWLVRDGTCKPLEGDLDEYRASLSAPRPRSQSGNGGGKKRGGGGSEARARLADQRRAIKAIEDDIARLTKERASIRASLADQSIYVRAKTEAIRLGQRLADVERAIDAAETAWLDEQATLEQVAARA
jgi:ATP-binding cassette subfamily F protein 3